MIEERLESVRLRVKLALIKRGGGAEVKIVCVTKNIPIPGIEEALGLGLSDIGENRVQEALEKYRAIGTRADWHLIGHLQRNKVRDAVEVFSLIHSLDSERLARAIDNEARKLSKVQDVLVEVNISGESQKYGVRPNEVTDFIASCLSYPNIRIAGLMGMAPLVSGQGDSRPYFRRLRQIFDDLRSKDIKGAEMRYLSMGMSQDFEAAIEEGSNMVRIGSAIFRG